MFELWIKDEQVIPVTIVGTKGTIESVAVECRSHPRVARAMEEMLLRLVPHRTVESAEQGRWTAFLQFHPAFGLRWAHDRTDVHREDGMDWPGHFEVGNMYDGFRELFSIELGRLWYHYGFSSAHLDNWKPRTFRRPEVPPN